MHLPSLGFQGSVELLSKDSQSTVHEKGREKLFTNFREADSSDEFIELDFQTASAERIVHLTTYFPKNCEAQSLEYSCCTCYRQKCDRISEDMRQSLVCLNTPFRMVSTHMVTATQSGPLTLQTTMPLSTPSEAIVALDSQDHEARKISQLLSKTLLAVTEMKLSALPVMGNYDVPTEHSFFSHIAPHVFLRTLIMNQTSHNLRSLINSAIPEITYLNKTVKELRAYFPKAIGLGSASTSSFGLYGYIAFKCQKEGKCSYLDLESKNYIEETFKMPVAIFLYIKILDPSLNTADKQEASSKIYSTLSKSLCKDSIKRWQINDDFAKPQNSYNMSA